MGYGLDFLVIGIAIVAWRAITNRSRHERLANQSPDAAILNPLVLLKRQNPDLNLPALPSGTAVYEVWEVWFKEALRRITLASTRRSREETLKLTDQLLRYQMQIFTYVQNQELADLQLEAKKQELLVQIARSKAQIEALTNPDRSGGYQDPRV